MHSLAVRAGGGLCAGIWAVLALFRGSFWRLRERLPASVSPAKISVTAVIPARDEELSIASTVRSLAVQRHVPTVRIVVADDESSDETGSRAATAGAEVVRVAALPQGWKGKLWAVASGIAAAGGSPDYFLLTDADIEYVSDDVVSRLVAQAEKGFDLVSLMVRLKCESAAEQALIPAFVFFFFMLYPPKWVASGRGQAAAAGGCMLIRREMLEKVGGIESIRGALIDDCALAQAVRGAGGSVWLGIADEEVRSLRDYGSAGEIRAMIARSAFAQLRHSALLLAGTVAGLVITYLFPIALLFSGDPVGADLGAVAWFISAVIFCPVVRLYRAPIVTVVCLPAIACFYLLATVESAIRYWGGNGGVWKGRVQDAS
jgi:hopene-associated glycosyltransferase HpnB